MIKKLALVILIAVLALPAAFMFTVFTFPFWRWLEETTGIESYGHSGPADWCYWLVYGLLLLITALIWYLLWRKGERH